MGEPRDLETVEQMAHTSVDACYQCGKCSAGCPVADRMDVLPHQLLRLAQLGRIEKAVRSGAIWQCVSCLTCSTRCPKSVDCAGVIDALRQLSVERNQVSPDYRRTVLFQEAFLENIRRNGRLAELELIGAFKTSAFLKDMNLPLLMNAARKVPPACHESPRPGHRPADLPSLPERPRLAMTGR
jgi:heterodisulfide reductase subunit C